MTKNEWRAIFGDNLSDLLEDFDMSQKQLAKECNLSTGSISGYINKWSVPSITAIINMSYTLDVSVDDLVDFGDRIDE